MKIVFATLSILSLFVSGCDADDIVRELTEDDSEAAASAASVASGATDQQLYPSYRIIAVSENPESQYNDTEIAMVEATNVHRVRHGLRPLILDPAIQRTCRAHCDWMCSSGRMQHGNSYPKPGSENIAMGQQSVGSVIQTWINSHGHNANMLGPYTKCGMTGFKNRNGTIFWCQQFGR